MATSNGGLTLARDVWTDRNIADALEASAADALDGASAGGLGVGAPHLAFGRGCYQPMGGRGGDGQRG